METSDRQAEWARLEVANQKEMLAYLGTSPLAQVEQTNSLHWVITKVPSNDYNGVLSTQLTDSAIDSTIQRILDRFQAERLPFVWFIDQDTTPIDLSGRLVSRGCSRLDPGQGMAIELPALPDLLLKRSDLVVRRVNTPDELEAWMDVWTQMHGEARQPRIALYKSLLLRSDHRFRHYVAWLNGKPVGTTQLFLGKRSAGLYCEAVLPTYQRQGIGTALVVEALREAYLAGSTTVFTGPTPESASMYRRLGFRVFKSQGDMYHRWPDML